LLKPINHLRNILKQESVYVYLIVAVLTFQLLSFAFGSISLAVFSAVSLLNAAFNRPKKISALAPPIIYFIVIVTSLTPFEDSENVSSKLVRALPFLFVPLSFSFVNVLTRKGIQRIFVVFSNVLVLYTIILLINALVRYKANKYIDVFFYHELSSLFDINAVYLSMVLLLSYIFLLTKTKVIWDYFKLLLIFIAIVLLSSKMILLLAVALSVFIGLKRTSPLKIRILFLSVFSLIFVFLLKSTKISERVNNEMQSNLIEVLSTEKFNHVYFWTGSSIRLFQGRIFWELLQEDKKYFFGYGFNSSQERITAKHIQYELYPGFYSYNFHNQYFQTMAELGCIGLFSLGLMFYSLFRSALKSKLIWPITIGVIFLILFLTESYLVRQRGIVYFLFYYCLIFEYNHQR
jgi:O-antigen ligase